MSTTTDTKLPLSPPQTRRVVVGYQDAQDLEAPDLPTEPLPLNMGPSHPAMHGTVRMVLEVEGERISSADIQIGYLHRCFEKESENATWTQVFPYTDRLNYISPMLNNVGYAMAVEQLLGIDKAIPERAQFIRVIVGEVSRISDHLTCLGASAMELGAFTVFLYMLKAREWLFELLEEVCGARLTVSYLRIGGCAWDRPDGIGIITQEQCLQYGITGPVGRSTGLAYDVRKDAPYLVYDRFDFDVPVGSVGDNFDRYAVRVEEMLQSMRILEQALEKIPAGPVMIADPRIALPPKSETYNSIEAMIAHFEIIMDGVHV